MQTIFHLALSVSIVAAVQPALAQEPPASGWLTRSIDKEAARLAANAPPDPDPAPAEPGASNPWCKSGVAPRPARRPLKARRLRIPGVFEGGATQPAGMHRRPDAAGLAPPAARQPTNWSRVRSLPAGKPVVVEVRGALPALRHFILADDAEIIVLNADHAQLPEQVRRTLLEAASASPEHFGRLREGVRFLYRNVRVTPDVIFLAGQQVAETADIVQRIPRADVAAIMTPPYRRGSVAGAVGGAIAGGLAGFFVARRLVFSTNKNAEVWMVVSLVGFPLGGALLGSQVERGVTQRVIYRAP